MLETLSILIHADSKVGKTTLAATAPPPLLILDAEGGSKFLPIRKHVWDPKAGGPPAHDGTWDACVVIVRDFETIRMVYQWLQSGQHQFVGCSVRSRNKEVAPLLVPPSPAPRRWRVPARSSSTPSPRSSGERSRTR
jgi:hypothetical protein